MNEETQSEFGRSVSVTWARSLTGGAWAAGWLMMISICWVGEWIAPSVGIKAFWLGLGLVHLSHLMGHVYAKEYFKAFWLFIGSFLIYPAFYWALLVSLSGNLQESINPFVLMAALIHFPLIAFAVFDAGRAARRRNRLSSVWR